MPPLTYAMCLVDRESANTQTLGQLEKTRREYPFGSGEDEVMMAGGNLALRAANLREIHAAMQRDGWIAAGAQGIDLVLHERDKRRDYDVGASGDRRRHLVAERLAAPGRHHYQRIAAIQTCLDRLCLQRAKTLKTPETAQRGEDFVGWVPSCV